MRNNLPSLVLALGAAAAIPVGAEYTYTKIADNGPGSQFSGFDTALLINNRGAVAFNATLQDGSEGIFLGSGNDQVSTVFRETAEIRAPFVTGLNDAGTIVFTASGARIFTSTGNSPFLVVQGTTEEALSSLSYPSINNSGTVAWTTATRVYTRTGGGPVSVAVENTDLPRALAIQPAQIMGVRINNSGTVGFSATRVAVGGACQCGLFTKTGASMATITDTVTSLYPPLNDAGTVAFVASIGSKTAVYVGRGGPVSVAAEPPPPVTVSPFNVGINNHEQVAFQSAVLGPVLTGPEPVRDRVIGPGDPLFGSTVVFINPSVYPGRLINDAGQVVFSYMLTNGVSGLAVATPSGSAGRPRPVLPNHSIVNAASFARQSPLAPGSVAAIFGADFASKLTVASTTILPSSLDGIQVRFNGIAAPLFFVAPGQLNAQIPFEIDGPSAELQVTTPGGQSEIRTVAISRQAPAIYSLNQQGTGQGVIVFANTATLVADLFVTPDSRPARAGEIVTIYANGLGPVEPPIPTGQNSCSGGVCSTDLSNLTLRRVVVTPRVEIGGVTVPEDHILFAGLAPQFVGLYQINLRIPSGIAPGDHRVVIHQGTASSQPFITLAIR